MKVLIACEFSGIIRESFISLGHEAYSCDLEESEIPSPFHIKDDVLNHLNEGWDLMIGHPPCTKLAVSGARFWKRSRSQQFKAIKFFQSLYNADIPRVAIENPVGFISKWQYPTQIIQPYQFGDPYKKRTCLWLINLPKLVPFSDLKNEAIPQCHWEGPGINRSKNRSRTYPGIAKAMASQWGSLSMES